MPTFSGTGLELDSSDAKASKADSTAIKALRNAVSRAGAGHGHAAAEYAADALMALCDEFGLAVHDYLR